MELLRVNRDAYGQEVLAGVSWDLLWVFAGAAIAFVIVHMLYKAFVEPRGGPKHAAPDATEQGPDR